VDGGKEFVEVAEVVLPELTGGVAHGLERRGNGHGLRRYSDGGACLTDRGHAGPYRKLAGDEVGATCRATCLRIVVSEAHALSGELVEVRRPASHHALVVGTDIPIADIVAHNHNDVGLMT
jgi:hypothetical protein